MNNSYIRLKTLTSKELNLTDEKIKEQINKNPSDLSEYFNSFLFLNSKRLRPLFIFLVCDFLDIKITDEIIELASAIELLHSASLIHDDILDNGTLRRNLPCLHTKCGYKTAVLAGDYLLSIATSLLPAKAIKTISNATNIMVKSEINTLLNRYKTPSLEEYINYSKEKTSTLFTSSIKSIFLIKEIKEDKNLISFAEQFSLCFQIRDDINNYLKKDENKFSNDIKQGIYTLPYIMRQKTNECDIILTCKEFFNNEIQKAKNLLDNIQGKEKQNLLTLLNLLKDNQND